MNNEYDEFINSKMQVHVPVGFEPEKINEHLFDFQEAIVKWAIKRGRSAIFADTGLGKTRMQLAWADQIVNYTQKPVIILTPLCVAQQTVREAQQIEIDGVRYCRTMALAHDARIAVINFEMLDAFDNMDVGGVVIDESSILKSVDGKTKTLILS